MVVECRLAALLNRTKATHGISGKEPVIAEQDAAEDLSIEVYGRRNTRCDTKSSDAAFIPNDVGVHWAISDCSSPCVSGHYRTRFLS
jgi:hypothetical protein